MKQPKPFAALAATLLLASTAPTPALSGDQESACGAILCLVGGSGIAECAGYLARYFAITAATPAALFDRRLDFLNLCPAPDLAADVRPMIASYGATCQPAQLVAYLNQQISWCGLGNFDGNAECRPTGDEWQLCAPFYEHAYTTYEAPQLHEQCEEVPDTDGSLVERCTYTWVLADETGPAGG